MRRIDRVQLGAVMSVDAGTHGTYYFDAFESRRDELHWDRTGGGGLQRQPDAGPAPLTVQLHQPSRRRARITLSYVWDFGDGGSSTEANPVHTYVTEGPTTSA